VAHGKQISVIGCGKLGLPLVAVLSDVGHKVIAMDKNVKLVESLDRGSVPWYEPDLQEALDRNRSRILYTTSFSEAVRDCAFALIIVPSPSDDEGWFDKTYVEEALINLTQEHMRINSEPLTVVIISTLMPGTVEELKRRVQSVTGGASNLIRIVYSPEFIALGSVVSDMKNPSLVLIGSDDNEAAKDYIDLVSTYVKTEPHFAIMSYESAEIAKIGVNSYVTMKISFANFISELCDATNNASAYDVLTAIGSDSRIGRSYLKSGTPFGGPCFPRDNVALAKYAESRGVPSLMPTTVHSSNDLQIERIAKEIEDFIPKDFNMILVGYAYKPGTPVFEESASAKVLEKLRSRRNVFVVDSYVDVINVLPENVFDSSALSEGPVGAVLMVPDIHYQDWPTTLPPNSFLFDCWGSWSDYSSSNKFRYRRLGEGKHA
jgi:UDPglucose 6-dehydrogenase